MNRKLLGTFALMGGLMAGHPASATIMFSEAVGGSPTGVNYENFNTLTPGSNVTTLLPSNILISFSGSAGPVQGGADGLYAAPFLSGANGSNFGVQPNGNDLTTYLSPGSTSAVSGSAITLTLPVVSLYFGLLWGSIDPYNMLEFFNGSQSVGTLEGSTVLAGANGNQGLGGTRYVNITSTTAFTSVVATSSQYAFEFDNVAFSEKPIGVPEPLTLSVLGMGLLGLGMIRRQRSRSV